MMHASQASTFSVYGMRMVSIYCQPRKKSVYVVEQLERPEWRTVQKFEHRRNFNVSEHDKMDANKEQDLDMEDEPSATSHQDATVSDSEDESMIRLQRIYNF